MFSTTECCSTEVKSQGNAVTKPGSMKYYILPLSLSFYCTCSTFLDLNPLPYPDSYKVKKQCSLQNSGNNEGRK